MKDNFLKSDGSSSRLKNLFRSKCGNPPTQLVKMCNMARKYLDAMGNSFIRGKRSPSIEGNKSVQRLTNQWADARFYKNVKELHPGCGQFWFLPGILKILIRNLIDCEFCEHDDVIYYSSLLIFYRLPIRHHSWS